MNVLYCGDKNIEDGLIISVLSLLKNVDENLNIYVLTINSKDWNIEGVTDDCIEVINSKMKKINKENWIKKIDITDLFEKEVPAKNMKTRFTPCCMLRLFADEVEELPDRILYLDNDVICRKDCKDFYNQNMDNYELARFIRLLWKVVF
jgi:lipopolysaccharide biosynthesis glycosyltransferase